MQPNNPAASAAPFASSTTWQREVFGAGAGFAINEQFINQDDNCKNIAARNAEIPEAVAGFLSDGPQQEIIDGYCSERETVG